MTAVEPREPVAGGRRPEVIVVGSGLAGLLAAAAAARAGCTVQLLDRDPLPDRPAPRPGVAQSEQSHVLLRRGLDLAGQLLPGLGDQLRESGAVPVDTGRLPWLGEFGWQPIGDHGFEILSATRPLLEFAVRRRVAALDGVRLRSGIRVERLLRHPDRWLVQGSSRTGKPLGLAADLVVDASGRGSRLPQWLQALGVPPPPVTRVDARIGYATRRYRGDGGTPVVIQATPATARGGLALPVEDGGWLVTAVGAGECRPPRDPEQFEAFLQLLRDDALARQVAGWSPDGEVALHRQTANLRRHYEQLRDWPPGLLALGDALCAFNPVYGQGITVAAAQAVVLGRALGDAGGHHGLDAARTRELQRSLARQVDFPWAVATAADQRMPSCEGRPGRAQALIGRWGQEVTRLAAGGDLRAARALSRTYHLIGSPTELLHPRLVLAAFGARFGGPGRRPAATARPQALD